MNGAIYWTLREFAVQPDWDGGAQRAGVARDAIHNKGLLTYEGAKPKPAWAVAERDFTRTPLYTSPMPRPVAPSLARPPVATAPATSTTALAAILLTVLLAIGGLLVWLTRDVWRLGGRPEPPALADELEERRRIRAAA
jgi:beta-glucuronidase